MTYFVLLLPPANPTPCRPSSFVIRVRQHDVLARLHAHLLYLSCPSQVWTDGGAMDVSC